MIAWLAMFWITAGAALAQGAAPPDGYRIAGRVVNAESGAPLGGAAVAILTVVNGTTLDPEEGAEPPRRGRRGRRGPTASALDSVTTAADGSFVFDHVPAGKYSLQGSHRGFITAAYQEHGLYSTAIVTGPGSPSEGLVLKLSPGAVISGSVLDTAGDPITEASVSLYRQSDDGLGSVRLYRSTNIDDLGAYEFAHLTPGTYFVSAAGSVWYAQPAHQDADDGPTPVPAANLNVVYPRSFYADATDSSAATPIPVRGGERLRIDLHMQAVPAVHLTYSIPTNSGITEGIRFPQVAQSVFGAAEATFTHGAMAMRQTNQGEQTMSVSIAPGEYEIEVAGRTLTVNAAGDTVLDPQTGAPPSEVSGKIAAVPGVTLPESVDLTLDPADSRGGTLSAIAHDGVFRFEPVRPGAYEIGAQSEGRPMAIVDAAASGGQLRGHVLQVGAQPVIFAAMVAPESAILSGFARIAAPPSQPATGAPGAMVVLVPQHLGDHALYRRDQSDSDGSFSLRQVAPGTYSLVAIEDGWDLEWARPEVIAHYLPGGLPVKVTAADNGVIHLTKPVIVQGR
jgi:hypothetical protein